MKRKYSVEYWTWFNGSASPQHTRGYRSLRCAIRAADRLARRHLDGRYVGWERYKAFVCVALGRETVYKPYSERAMSVGERGVW